MILREVIHSVKDGLSGKMVVSCAIPMDTDKMRLIIGTTRSGAEELAKKNLWTHIVAAFQTVPGEVLFPPGFGASYPKRQVHANHL